MKKFLAALIVWWLIGSGSFVYWTTAKLDLTASDIPFVVAAGVGGPVVWFAGWITFGNFSFSDPVLVHKREVRR